MLSITLTIKDRQYCVWQYNIGLHFPALLFNPGSNSSQLLPREIETCHFNNIQPSTSSSESLFKCPLSLLCTYRHAQQTQLESIRSVGWCKTCTVHIRHHSEGRIVLRLLGHLGCQLEYWCHADPMDTAHIQTRSTEIRCVRHFTKKSRCVSNGRS